jgi:oligoribonuclease NrnB/cAMP/cGMP phosphodiesterase (DHH superfamily)
MSFDQPDIVIYHKGCNDGIAAAWCFYVRYYEEFKSGSLRLIGSTYQMDPPEDSLIKDKNIILVDFSYKYKVLETLSPLVKSIIILDHHKAARDDIEKSNTLKNVKTIFDMERSGCQIAWDYLYSSGEGICPDWMNEKIRSIMKNKEIGSVSLSLCDIRPWFIEFIADNDLWKHERPNCKAVIAGMKQRRLINWEEMTNLFNEPPDDEERLTKYIDNLVAEGNAFLSIEQYHINLTIKKAIPSILKTKVTEKSYKVALVTCDFELISKVGDTLCHQRDDSGTSFKYDFVAVWNYNPKYGSWSISLRGDSSINGEIDLSAIAVEWGGGGHMNASAFSFKDPEKLQNWFSF